MTYNSTPYGKDNGKHKLQTRLSRNYDFVFTNLLKIATVRARLNQQKAVFKFVDIVVRKPECYLKRHLTS